MDKTDFSKGKLNFNYSYIYFLRINFIKDILVNGELNTEITTDFLQKVVDLIFIYIKESFDRNEKVKLLVFSLNFQNMY
jgi:hypothetical protein